MISKSRWNMGVSSAVALIAVFVMACPPAHAQVKPFKITGEGVAPQGLPLPGQPSRPHWIVGNATELGRHYGAGRVETDTANFLPNGHITGEFGSDGPFKFIAANGDILACEYGRVAFGASKPGTFELVPLPALGVGIYQAYFVAEFVPQGEECTGRFAGVSGSWVMYAVTAPFVLGSTDPLPYSWQGEGSLTFNK